MIIDMHEYLLFLVDQIQNDLEKRDIWINELDYYVTEEVGDKLWTTEIDYEQNIPGTHDKFKEWIADYYDKAMRIIVSFWFLIVIL